VQMAMEIGFDQLYTAPGHTLNPCLQGRRRGAILDGDIYSACIRVAPVQREPKLSVEYARAAHTANFDRISPSRRP